jgi:tRNA (guanine37-N1)-methyltransferase
VEAGRECPPRQDGGTVCRCGKIFSEGRRDLGKGIWTEEGLAEWSPECFYDQLKQEKKEGWAAYLHYTKDVPDGMISVDHKTGRIEHLFVTARARGKGIGQKMLDFARKKLPEHEHPVLTVLDKNTRAIALYRRMGWKLTGEAELVFDPAKDSFVQMHCELLVMRFEG